MVKILVWTLVNADQSVACRPGEVWPGGRLAPLVFNDI